MLSGVSLLAVSNVKNPVGLVRLPYVMWSAHFFVTHIQTERQTDMTKLAVAFRNFANAPNKADDKVKENRAHRLHHAIS